MIDAVEALIRRTRVARGLPATITDPSALAKVAAIISTVPERCSERDDAPVHQAGAPVDCIATSATSRKPRYPDGT